jgi:hypothetical protein
LDDDVGTTPATERTISTKSSSCSSSNPPTPRRLNFCGVQEWCQTDNGLGLTDLVKVEYTINNSLGSTVEINDWCQGWQAWSAFNGLTLIDSERYSNQVKSAQLSKTDENEWKLCVQRSLRSRAFDMTLRKKRLASLQQNLNPFDEKCQEPPALQKTKSFHVNEKYHHTQQAKKKREKAKISLISVLDCSALRCSAVPDVNSPAVIRKEHQEVCIDQGYDSDPELFSRPTKTSIAATTTAPRHDKPKKLDFVPCDAFGDPGLSRLVHDFFNEKITLLLHRDCRKNHSTRTSCAVHAWVDRGQRLRDRIILPKFVWMPVTQNNNTVKRQCDETFSVDLLDICRLLNVTQLDRTRYPFARIPNSFLLRTMQEDLIFEASSHEERNRLVHTLKHVVARFASKILLQDESAISEFFAHRLPGPGDMPHWLDSEKAPT